MLKFSANLSLLFTELDLIDRFKAAKDCGFEAVEIQFPYALAAEQIQQQLITNQLELVLFNVAADDLLQGGEGLACVPEKQALFKQALAQCKAYAEILQPEAINILPGQCKNPARRQAYRETFKSNLSLALASFSPLGIKTVFEAINVMDMPDFIIHNGQQMLEIMRQMNDPMLLMQYDIYHMHKMNEDVVAFLAQYSDKIGHIQFADDPGRAQPGSGSIDFKAIFSQIEKSGYRGWTGAEYNPSEDTLQSLDWFQRSLAD
ncbi:MAG TPA: hydroxypyruvate isomerase [Methylococcaceae bacterium]|nr:hydroxypyruvate isomerase [Methylococcaceae bacterium]